MLHLRRPSRTTTVLLAAWAVFCGWVGMGLLAVSDLEEPAYEVVGRDEGYEVREYGPLMAATVSVAAPWSEAYAMGFAFLSAYTGGDNTTQQGIAVSVPAFAAQKDTAWLISFVMPSRWTEATLPRPNDPRIRIVRIPQRTVAVLTFSGSAGRDQSSVAEGKLHRLLERDKAVILGPATVAQYHPTWAPPFVRRNEIIIPIRP